MKFFEETVECAHCGSVSLPGELDERFAWMGKIKGEKIPRKKRKPGDTKHTVRVFEFAWQSLRAMIDDCRNGDESGLDKVHTIAIILKSGKVHSYGDKIPAKDKMRRAWFKRRLKEIRGLAFGEK